MKKYIFLASVLFLLSSCVLFNNNPTKLYNKAMKLAPFDAAIVPGVPYYENNPDSTMKGRVIWAVYLYKKGIVKNVIFSGSAVYSPYYEGKAMALYGEKLGIPKEHIFAETQAEHSVENVYYGYKIAEKNGMKKVALVTDPFQASLLKGLLKKYYPHIIRIPFVADSMRTFNGTMPAIDASSAHADNFVALPDRESTFKRLQGTRGKKVKRMMREDRRNAKVK